MFLRANVLLAYYSPYCFYKQSLLRLESCDLNTYRRSDQQRQKTSDGIGTSMWQRPFGELTGILTAMPCSVDYLLLQSAVEGDESCGIASDAHDEVPILIGSFDGFF